MSHEASGLATHRRMRSSVRSDTIHQSASVFRTLHEPAHHEVDVRLKKRLAVERCSIRKHETPDGNLKNQTREHVPRRGRRVMAKLSRFHALLDQAREGGKRRRDEAAMIAIDRLGKASAFGEGQAQEVSSLPVVGRAFIGDQQEASYPVGAGSTKAADGG